MFVENYEAAKAINYVAPGTSKGSEPDMARLRWIGRNSGQTGAGRHLAGEASQGHALAVRLARGEVERTCREDLLAGDWETAKERFKRACRMFGVVVAAAASGLDRLDRYLYQPPRDACLLTVILLEGEVADRTGRGVPLRSAFDEVADSWLQDFGMLLASEKLAARRDAGLPSRVTTVITQAAGYQTYPPYSYPPHLVLLQRAEEAAARGRARAAAGHQAADEAARRMRGRRATFQAGDADFQGPGGREVMRAIFVTVLLLRDAVHSRASKVPQETFALSYRQVLGRYRLATASLVLDAAPGATPWSRPFTS
jgi:hypothetical protein